VGARGAVPWLIRVPRASQHYEAAVDGNALAGDHRGIVGNQERHRTDDVVRGQRPLDGLLVDRRFEDARSTCGPPTSGCPHQPGAMALTVTPCGVLAGKSTHQTDDRPFVARSAEAGAPL